MKSAINLDRNVKKDKRSGMIDSSILLSSETGSHLTFGIYPGGVAGTDNGLAIGPPDNQLRINEALARLQGENRALLVRGYIHYNGTSSLSEEGNTSHPANLDRYAINGRKLDLVVCFRDTSGDVRGWLSFIRTMVRRHGSNLAKVQITEEPNLYDAPGSADGCMPNVQQALMQGVIVAKEEACQQGYNIQVGFNAVPSFNSSDDFWTSIGRLGQQSFLEAVDYVGLDCFPDVFHPVAADDSPGNLRDAVTFLLTQFRSINLPTGNIPPSTPIHITENGWPTGPVRSYERQSTVLRTMVQTICAHQERFNITHYEHFALRDADSSNPNLFYQFGLLRDDYTPKPAFEVYCKLVDEVGATL
jgi:hypothetical protein